MYAHAALHHRAPPGPGFLARLFGWAEKASKVGPLIARLVKGQAVWSERDFAKLAREGYQQNPVVARAVQIIAESVAQIPWCLYEGKGDDRTEIEEHAFLDLMQSPNPSQDWQSLIAALVSNYKISGNLYCERTEETKIERMELYAHRPDRISIVPSEDGLIAAYKYRAGGQERDFDMDLDKQKRPLLHLKTFNPTNDWYGLSPLDPCAWAIDISNASAKWNMSILNNAGAPSGALMYVGGENKNERMGPEHYQQTLDMLRGDIQGSANAGRPMLLEGGFDWKPFGFNPEQMEYVEGANHANRQIAFCLGVPPQLLGIPGDNTYSNYQEARQAFYQESVIPLAKMLVRAFNQWFAKSLGKGVYLECNIDDLDALSEVRKETWERIEKSEQLTINEKRDAMGYEAVDGGDELYVNAGKIPLSMTLDLTTQEQDHADREQDRADEALAQKKPPKGKKGGGPVFRSPPVVHRAER
jgi:HK97 family phage portal protein